jgi:hypothetical protein
LKVAGGGSTRYLVTCLVFAVVVVVGVIPPVIAVVAVFVGVIQSTMVVVQSAVAGAVVLKLLPVLGVWQCIVLWFYLHHHYSNLYSCDISLIFF